MSTIGHPEPTIGQSIHYYRNYKGGAEPWPEFIFADHMDAIVDFADDMVRMLAGLGRISFPIPGHLQITLDPDDESDAIFITTATADRIHRALGEALRGQTKHENLDSTAAIRFSDRRVDRREGH